MKVNMMQPYHLCPTPVCCCKSLRSGAIALVVFVLLCLATPGFAQLDRGTILGTVLDQSGAVIPGATVQIQNQGTGFAVKLTTNTSGSFIVPELPVGTYQVSASQTGFATRVVNNISLHASDRINVELKLRPGSVRQTITVTGVRSLVQTSTTTYGAKILSTEISNLPINGRDPMQLLVLQPGTNLLGGNGSINGQNETPLSSDSTNFLVDGGDSGRVDDETLDNTYGASANRITHAGADAIQEFSISQNSFSAEYGGNSGSVVNIITKSGTNALHGDAYDYFRNDVLDARNYFDPAPNYKPAFRLNQFGGSLGGPIKKDKAWFFGNYEGIRQRTGVTLVNYVPTQAFRQTLPAALQPVVAMLPLPNGPVSATEPQLALYSANPSNLLDEDTALGKVDYDVTSRDRLTVRYNMEDSLTENHFGVAEGQISPIPGLLQNSQLSYTRNISNNMVNVASFTFNRMHIDPLSSTSAAIRDFPIVSIPGSAGVGPALFNLLVANNSFEGMDTLNWLHGRNQLAIGTQIIRNQDNKELGFQETVDYTTLAGFANNAPFSVGTLGQPRAGIRNTYYAFFAQDNAQVTQKLSADAGLRYQYDSAPSESHGRIDNFDSQTGQLTPMGDAFINMPTLNFAPRLGLAYKPFTSRQMVIRASFGIFYNVLVASTMQNFPNNIFQQSSSLTQIQDPTLVGFPFPTITSFAGVTSYSAIQHNWLDPYVESWNFDVQQGIGQNGRLDVAYVGSHSVHLYGNINLNRFYPGTSNKPYPNLGSVGLTDTPAFGNWDALEVSFTRRFSHGFQLGANYTWGHMLDDTVPLFSSVQDDHNPLLDYGNDPADVTNVLEFDYVYQLPSAPRIPRAIGSGWQVNGITEMRSGLPYSVSCGCDPMQVGQTTGRANEVPGVPIRPASFDIPSDQLNIAAFTTPPTGTWGTTGRDIFRGPAAYTWDFSLFKNFHIRENQILQFRAEVFNIFNTPLFNNPGASLTSPASFGESLSTLTNIDGFPTQRQIQFALRYQF